MARMLQNELKQGAGYLLVPTSPRQRPLSWKNSSVLFSSLLYIISTCSRGCNLNIITPQIEHVRKLKGEPAILEGWAAKCEISLPLTSHRSSATHPQGVWALDRCILPWVYCLGLSKSPILSLRHYWARNLWSAARLVLPAHARKPDFLLFVRPLKFVFRTFVSFSNLGAPGQAQYLSCEPL